MGCLQRYGTWVCAIPPKVAMAHEKIAGDPNDNFFQPGRGVKTTIREGLLLDRTANT